MRSTNERAYISTITGVREAGLRGAADLAYWQNALHDFERRRDRGEL